MHPVPVSGKQRGRGNQWDGAFQDDNKKTTMKMQEILPRARLYHPIRLLGELSNPQSPKTGGHPATARRKSLSSHADVIIIIKSFRFWVHPTNLVNWRRWRWCPLSPKYPQIVIPIKERDFLVRDKPSERTKSVQWNEFELIVVFRRIWIIWRLKLRAVRFLFPGRFVRTVLLRFDVSCPGVLEMNRSGRTLKSDNLIRKMLLSFVINLGN